MAGETGRSEERRTAGDPSDEPLTRLPRGLPSSDQDLWVQLSPAAKRDAVRRLRAVHEWLQRGEAGSGARDGAAARLAEEAGVTRKRFYELVRRCGGGPTLAGLGVRADAAVVRGTTMDPSIRHTIEKTLDEALRTAPDVGTEDALRRVRRLDLPKLPARSTLLRWFADARRRAVPGEPFGAQLLLDVAYLELTEETGRPHALHVLVDATGLVLGWALRSDGLVWRGHAEAVADGARRLGTLTLGRSRLPPMDRPPALDMFVMADRDPVFPLQFIAGLDRFEVMTIDLTKGRFVRPIRRHIGDRIARTRVHGRPEHVRKGAAVATAAAVERIVDRSISAHNRIVLGHIAGPEDEEHARVRSRIVDGLSAARRPVDAQRD